MPFKYHVPSIYTRALMVVSIPSEEALWAGGTILKNPGCRWNILSVFKSDKAELDENFEKAGEALDAKCINLGLDFIKDNQLITSRQIEHALMDSLTMDRYDIILTHSLYGEVTRNLLQPGTGKAVLKLRKDGNIRSDALYMFAYDDKKGKILPEPVMDCDKVVRLPDEVFAEKRRILSEIYKFSPESTEMKTASKIESYWQFK
jgi:hypothetical protein